MNKLKIWMDRIEKKSLPKGNDFIFCYHRSKFVRNFSIIILSLVFLLSLYFILFVNSGYLKWWVPFFSLVILSLGAISSPVAISIGKKEIELHCLLEVTRINISSIEHVYSLNSTYARIYIIPIMTTFGFLGYNGRYYDIKHQRWVKMVSSEHNNLIMIECIGRKSYIISATEREKVINIISERVHQSKAELREIIEKNYN